MKIYLRILLLSCILVSVLAHSAGSINSSFVAINEAQYDMNNKKLIDRNNVLNRLNKEVNFREIYEVKELPQEPKSVYIVKETYSVPVATKSEVDAFVLVNKQQSSAPWAYQNRRSPE
jgi:hypothetical protein